MKLTLNRDELSALILAHVDKMLPGGHVRRIDNAYDMPYEITYEITVAIDEPSPTVAAPPSVMPESEQERASRLYPSQVAGAQRLHIWCGSDGVWEVWVNTDERDFDGVCVARGDSRAAVVQAARVTLLSLAGVLGAQYLKEQ